MQGRDFEQYSHEEVFELVQQFEENLAGNGNTFLQEVSFLKIIEFYEERFDSKKAHDVTVIALEQYAFSAILWIKKARFLSDMGQSEQALQTLEHAYILDNQEIEMHLLKAEIFAGMQRYNESIEILNNCLVFADNFEKLDILCSLADIHESFFAPRQAFEALKKALYIAPGNIEILERINFCVDDLKNFEESINLHKEIIDLEPYSYHAWFNLGQAYAAIKLFEKAIDAYSYCLAIKENFYHGLMESGECFYELKQYSKALEFYLDAAKIERPDEDLNYSIGFTHYHLGNLGKAIYYFKKTISIDPTFQDAYFQLGRINQQQGLHEVALKCYKKAINFEEDNVEYLVAFADLCFLQSKHYQASENYLIALQHDPMNEGIWVKLSDCYNDLELFEEATLISRHGLNAIPNSSKLLYLNGIYEWKCGRKSAAFEFFEDALDISPTGFTIIFEYLPTLKQNKQLNQLLLMR